MTSQENVGRSSGKLSLSNQSHDSGKTARSGKDSPTPGAAPKKSCPAKDATPQNQATEQAREVPSRKLTHDSTVAADHQKGPHDAEAPPVPDKSIQHQQDKLTDAKTSGVLRKKRVHVGGPVATAGEAAPQSPASSESDPTDYSDELGATPPDAKRPAHNEDLNDEPPQGRPLPKPDAAQSTKPGSKYTTVTNAASSRPPSSEENPTARNSTDPKRPNSDAQRPPKPSHGTSSASTYAAALVSNVNATSAANVASVPIYEQQMRSRSPANQHCEDNSGQGDPAVDSMQVDFEEYVGVDREGARGHGEASGYSGGGGLIATVLGFGRSGPAPAPPNGKLEKEYIKAMKDNNWLQEELRKTQRQVEKYGAELQRAITEGRTYYRAAKDLQHDNQRLHDNVQSLEHELSNVTKQYQDAKSLSDTRGKELVGAQVFLNKADSLSISDLITKVNTLNEEIFQAAASLGDALHFSRYEVDEEEMKQRFKYTCGLIGEPLVQIVLGEAQKPEPVTHPLLVQITIQVYLTAFCAIKIQTWAASEPALDRRLQSLYRGIRASTDQAVSGRWRALTHAQLRSDSDQWGKESDRDLLALLSVASWQTAPEQRLAFFSKLPAIFKAVEDVKISLTEKFTSADIEITSVRPTTPFNKSIMEEAYSDEGAPNTGSVVATTGLGLSKVVHNPNNLSEMHFENVLTPTVVLDTSLKAALEPAPPRKKPKKRT